MWKLLRDWHNTAKEQIPKASSHVVFTVSQHVTQLPPASSPHYPCRQCAEWCSLFNRNSRQTGQPLLSRYTIMVTVSTKRYQNSLQRILMSQTTQQDREYKKRIMYYWHHKNQSICFIKHAAINKVFAFKEFLVCLKPLRFILWMKWLTLNHSSWPWLLGFSGTREYTMTV